MNDTFRQEYKELTKDQKEFVKKIKDAADNLDNIIETSRLAVKYGRGDEKIKDARKYLEISVMLAVKGVTA